VNRESLVFLIKAFGGEAGWAGPESPIDENDDSITHHVCDRPTQKHRFLTVTYVQPQWVYDAVNFRLLLPAEYESLHNTNATLHAGFIAFGFPSCGMPIASDESLLGMLLLQAVHAGRQAAAARVALRQRRGGGLRAGLRAQAQGAAGAFALVPPAVQRCTSCESQRTGFLGGGRSLTRPFRDARRFPSTRLL
jgi:hypothetical protein